MNTKLLSILAATALSLGMISCANDDVTDAANGQQGTTGTEGKLTTFTASAPQTRTSLNYNTGKYFWEAGDKIWVLDDTNTWNQSTNSITGTGVDYFKFTVPGTYGASSSYKVVYHSSSTSDNQVEIAAAQTQEAPNTTTHFGAAGDNGITAATPGSVGSTTGYVFKMDHKAAYLVFQPYTSNTIFQSCYLTKIEVTADNNIAGTFTLDPTTNQLTGTGTTNQIILTTKSASGTYANGFPLTNSTASVATNGAYMVIAPGTHTLKVRYWIKSTTANIEGAITKVYKSKNYQPNEYYDLTANLDTRVYPGTNYYMWDAQQNYWAGYEWNSANPQQPTIDMTDSPFYPQSKTADPTRWYNDTDLGLNVRNDAQTALFKTLPNANEMAWYAMNGDPRWDSEELGCTMGRLFKGGMWFKKKANIPGFTDTHGPDGKDFRTDRFAQAINSSLTSGLPSAGEAGEYFYLPALGGYGANGGIAGGQLQYYLGMNGSYWTSSSTPDGTSKHAFGLYIRNGYAAVVNAGRAGGCIVQAFK